MRLVVVASVVAALLAALRLPSGAQTLSVSATSVDLPTPDTIAYDSGFSSSTGFSVVVESCADALGCDLTMENPFAASTIPLDVQWRLVAVGQTGTGSPGCVARATLLAWQSLGGTPADLMNTGPFTDVGTSCVATVEVRANNLSYADHQYTTPTTTYWRDLLFRVVGK